MADIYKFNGKTFRVASSGDFRDMLAELTADFDQSIEQIELLKQDLFGTQRVVIDVARRNSMSDGSQIGVAAALSGLAGRRQVALTAPSSGVQPQPGPVAATQPAQAMPLVQAYSASQAYPTGAVVLFNGGLFQWQGVASSSAGQSPLTSLSWVALSAVLDSAPYNQWTYVDITSPALAAVTAPASTITAQQTTAGTALAAITAQTLPGSTALMTHLDVEILTPQNTPGIALPTDATVLVRPFVSYSASANTWTITPEWVQQATAAAAAIAAAAAGVYRTSVRYRQRP